MLKSVHQYPLSSTFSSTFTRDLIVQISISLLKMDKKRLSTMIKYNLFRMQDMSVALKHVGVCISSVCMKTLIQFTDFPSMNQIESEFNTKKERNNRLCRKPVKSQASWKPTLTSTKMMLMQDSTFTTRSLNITLLLIQQESGRKDRMRQEKKLLAGFMESARCIERSSLLELFFSIVKVPHALRI